MNKKVHCREKMVLPGLAVLVMFAAVAICQPVSAGLLGSKTDIVWRTLEEGKEEAAARDMPILVDFYASPACPRCLDIDNTVYNDPAMVSKINHSFIPVRIWVSRPLSWEAKELEKILESNGECILAFLKPDGSVIRDAKGNPVASMEMLSKEQYMSYMEQALVNRKNKGPFPGKPDTPSGGPENRMPAQHHMHQ